MREWQHDYLQALGATPEIFETMMHDKDAFSSVFEPLCLAIKAARAVHNSLGDEEKSKEVQTAISEAVSTAAMRHSDPLDFVHQYSLNFVEFLKAMRNEPCPPLMSYYYG